MWPALLVTAVYGAAAEPSAEPREYFQIRVVDEQTGREVPLVELRTVDNVRYLTDSAGLIALAEPALFDQKVFFHVQSHGYEFPKDHFGYRGAALAVTRGGSTELRIKRLNIAERLYRVTGADIYRDSVLVGRPAPIRAPLLNAQVVGSDSVMSTLFRGRIYWFWGDTNRTGYPLGNFDVPGATSRLPDDGGLDPAVGVDLEYFVDQDGFAKRTARMPGDGPTWIDGLVALGDKGGGERMFAAYVKIRKFLEAYARGLAEWNDQERRFEQVAEFPVDAPLLPHGHALHHMVGGVEYVYFGNPYPLVRVRAQAERLKQLEAYEAFTCLVPGSPTKDAKVELTADGHPLWAWKSNTPMLSAKQQAELIRSGKLKRQQALLQLQDVETGQAVEAHAGSVAYNALRRRWVLIANQAGGTSALGEVWCAEADHPHGPWVYARKVVTHDRYSFYNPKHHPDFDQDGGRVIYFEGTYSNFFSGNPDQTPRYDYNQIMYRLDLSDPQLVLPVAVYRVADQTSAERLISGTPNDSSDRALVAREHEIAFFGLDRPGTRTVPVFSNLDAQGRQRLSLEPTLPAAAGKTGPLCFYALPADLSKPPRTTMALYEYVQDESGARVYTTNAAWQRPGYRRREAPLCRVWRNPYEMPFPNP